jgi:hypothetical protein
MSSRPLVDRCPVTIATLFITGALILAGLASAQDVGMFSTGTRRNGDLGGLAAADARCDSLGTAAYPGSGPWVAWLSDSTADARDRIAQPGAGGAYVFAPVPSTPGVSVSPPGTILAHDLTDLTDGFLLGVPAAGRIWTGTDSTGSATGSDCLGWTSIFSRDRGSLGDPVSAAGAGEWTESSASPTACSNLLLEPYCFGPLPVPAPAIPLPALTTLALVLLVAGVYLTFRRRAAAERSLPSRQDVGAVSRGVASR